MWNITEPEKRVFSSCPPCFLRVIRGKLNTENTRRTHRGHEGHGDSQHFSVSPVKPLCTLWLEKKIFPCRLEYSQLHRLLAIIMDSSSSRIDPAFWKKAFDALQADHQNVLYFIAIHTAPIRKVRIQEAWFALLTPPAAQTGEPALAKKKKEETVNNPRNSNKVNTITEQLQQLGWLEVTAEGLCRCKNELREQIIHHLRSAGQYK